MSEHERERIFWRISLIFILLSPWLIYSLGKAPPTPGFHPFLFLMILVSSIPFAFLLEIVITKLFGKTSTLRFWIVKPSVRCENRINNRTVDSCLQAISERLHSLNFEWKVSEAKETVRGAKRLEFQKSKTQQVHAFINHAFSGKGELFPSFDGTDLKVELTFEDTIVLETGEMTEIQALCNYIALKSSEFTASKVSFTLYTGLGLAFATAIASLSIVLQFNLSNTLLFCLAFGGAGTILLTLVSMLKERQNLFGYRLAFAGLYLSVMPYLSWFIPTSN